MTHTGNLYSEPYKVRGHIKLEYPNTEIDDLRSQLAARDAEIARLRSVEAEAVRLQTIAREYIVVNEGKQVCRECHAVGRLNGELLHADDCFVNRWTVAVSATPSTTALADVVEAAVAWVEMRQRYARGEVWTGLPIVEGDLYDATNRYLVTVAPDRGKDEE